MSTSAAAAASSLVRFGRLWGRGHETFSPALRRILSVKGSGATTYLQGLVTCDLTVDPTPPQDYYYHHHNSSSLEETSSSSSLESSSSDNNNNNNDNEEQHVVEFNPLLRSACFLDHKGRIVTDALLWKRSDDEYLLDVPGDAADHLLSHLNKYKLRRSKVSIDNEPNMHSHVVYGTLNAGGTPDGFLAGLDPRHPSLGMRVVSLPETPQDHISTLMSDMFPPSPGTYRVLRTLAGVAEGSEILGKTALECNQEFLNAVSFHKGCYLGQELTARTMFKGAVRKRILPIFLTDTRTEVPRPWHVASLIQEGRPLDSLSGGGEDGAEGLQTTTTTTRLPPLSAASAGALMSMLLGTGVSPTMDNDNNDDPEWQALHRSGEMLQEQLQEVAMPGAKLVDCKDGKTIGQILSTPAPGTSVVLAQMRLDRVGLLQGEERWSRTNRVRIGENNKAEFRYLPYLPLWWPPLDETSGKAKEEDRGDE